MVAALGLLPGCPGALTSAVCACSESEAIANIAYRKPDENCISIVLLRIRRPRATATSRYRCRDIRLGLPAGLRLFPLGAQPAFLLQAVKGGIERTLVDLDDRSRDLLQALGNPVPMGGFER